MDDRRRFLLPDVLVLAAGGTVGEAWMTGVLAGLSDAARVDFRRVEQIVGTSAGSIVAASLVAGRPPRRPSGLREPDGPGGRGRVPEADPPRRPLSGALRAGARWAWAASAPLAAPVLRAGAPGGGVLRAMALARMPVGTQSLDRLRAGIDRGDARFDGRLRVVAVDRRRGRRVVFGAPGAPAATPGEAVAASCAVPWIFAPVTIGEREYVDGGVWSVTNLDVARAGRGTEVVCLSVMDSVALAASSPFAALRATTRAVEAVEAQTLRRRGANVRTIGPDAASADAIGPDLMDARRRERALAAGYRQGRLLGMP